MIQPSPLVLAAQTASPAVYRPAIAATVRPSHLDGAWAGGITVPAGLTIPFELQIEGVAGSFSAPDQNVANVPIDVADHGGQIVVTLPRGAARFVATLSADGTMLTGTWTRGDESFPAKFIRRVAGRKPAIQARPQTPRGPFPYRSVEVVVPGGAPDVRLAATLTTPSASAPAPAVLLIGGNGPQDRDETYAGHKPMLLLADRLTRAGVAVLRYDKRGVNKSSGRYDAATGEDLIADARAAFAWLRAQPGIARDRVCVLGLSEGAMIAPIVAADENAACAILLSAPGAKSPELLGEQTRLAALDAGATGEAAARAGELQRRLLIAITAGDSRAAQIDIAVAAGRSRDDGARLVDELAAPEVRVLLRTDPAAALRRLRMPVLVVAGGRDRQVAPAINLPPIRAALTHDRQATIIVYPDLNHVLQPALTGAVSEYATVSTTMDERVLAAVVRFATDRLLKPIQ